MNILKNKFKEIIDENWFSKFISNHLPGWKCVLNDTKDVAIILNDWRYPFYTDWYSINSICTESITVLYWYCVLEIDDEIKLLQVGDRYEILPWNKYSICWKSICRVDISPAWDSSQNNFIK